MSTVQNWRQKQATWEFGWFGGLRWFYYTPEVEKHQIDRRRARRHFPGRVGPNRPPQTTKPTFDRGHYLDRGLSASLRPGASRRKDAS